ncbi:MAG: hypothetical protein JWR84_3191 [Caulobacter sp.]|nr:hypothetical protein [Caulobacter sp.]
MDENQGVRCWDVRVGAYIQDIFRLARAERRVTSNPADDLSAALSARPPAKRRAALKAADLPKFLAGLDDYKGGIRCGSPSS